MRIPIAFHPKQLLPVPRLELIAHNLVCRVLDAAEEISACYSLFSHAAGTTSMHMKPVSLYKTNPKAAATIQSACSRCDFANASITKTSSYSSIGPNDV
jgi:hypothetical protein